MKRLRCPARWVASAIAITLSLCIVATDGPASVSFAADRVSADSARVANESCWSSATPLAALPPEEPIWCMELGSGPSTLSEGSNSWLDEFDHGLSHADLGPGYQVYADGAGQMFLDSRYFRHNDHWMVDVRGRNQPGAESNWGGTMMRPDRSFRFEDGRLVVEADVAAGAYDGGAWPELVVATAPAPGAWVDPLYAYGQFKGAWAVGCRLDRRFPICALQDPGGRRWESPFDVAGAQVWGGCPCPQGGEQDRAWRVCGGTDPDINCRDRFRLELTRDALALYVNGVRYLEVSQLPAGKQLDALVDAEVYPYFGSWIYRPDADTVRFHWDRLAVNPGTPPSAATTVPETVDASAHGH